MKKLTATAAIALALVSGSAFAAIDSADQPNSSSVSQIESRNASVEQVIAKNSGVGLPVTSADSHIANTHNAISLDQLHARNGATGEQTINADLDATGTASVKQSHNAALTKDLLQARNGATGEQTINADTQRTL
ncbi:hypothetical protein RN347_00660 [Halomonas sp. PAMB 3264]|uniref:hypothetical protein n=1 Tax=Halomonas sp. PAMB 3264 TaxID=3075222 RepID=UPI002898D0F1|nr:hypothetical protein [Halomonas sp. PAMB 3264]WNL42442.1 hypothetical protein RN347_00660 [Halomonas sp. PAMB 3264]